MPDAIVHRPTSGRRFSWAKLTGEGFVTYRLYRRSLLRRVHVRLETFSTTASRNAIARRLRTMRRELLDEVDAIDLRHLGVTEEAA